MRSGRFPAVLAGATLAMAHRSQLEGRLLAILDPRIPRRGLTRVGALAPRSPAHCAIVPLAALQPWTSEPAAQPPAQRAADAAVPNPSALQPPNVPTPRAAPRDPRRRSVPARRRTGRRPRRGVQADVEVADDRRGGRAAGSGDRAGRGRRRGRRLAFSAPGRHAAPRARRRCRRRCRIRTPTRIRIRTRIGAVTAAGRKADPRTIAALTAALKDRTRKCARRAMHALVQLRDPSIYEPLVDALHDASAGRARAGGLRPRPAARSAGGRSADRGLKDTNGSVREQAVFALGQLRDPRAVDG